ncbi:MAG: hypothetical protein ABUT39_02510 [Acidobacteriota bacterium]
MSWSFRTAAALPLLALVLLLATTSGETAIAPRPLAGLAAALLAGLLAAGARSKRWLDLAAAALLGIAASHLLLFPGLPRGHDVFHHTWGVWAVAREARAVGGFGGLMPLWVHGLGLGMPLLQFYGPAAFVVSLPFSLAGLAPVEALKASFLTFGAVASIGAYLAAARWTGDRRAALVAAAAYAFAPYRLIDVHYRLAFGESAGLAVLPFVLLLGSSAVRDGGWRRVAAGAAAIALLVVTHPISALIAATGMGIWTAAELALERRDVLARIGRLAGIWLLGAALAGFFVVPFAAESRYTSVERLARGEERAVFSDYGLTPSNLLERRLWSRLLGTMPAPDPRDGTDQEMPYYFGLVLLSLIPLGAGLRRQPRFPAGLLWTTLFALAFSLRPVAGAVSTVFPPLAVLQFPWRFLGLASFGTAALAGAAAARLLHAEEGGRPWARWWKRAVPGALAALLIFDAFPYTGAPEWFPGYEKLSYVRRLRPDCGRPWGCWETVPVDPPYPFRVSGLFLPPADPAIGTSYFCCAYPELETPLANAFSRPFRQPEVLIRTGVGLSVRPGQMPLRLTASPYAALHRRHDRPEPRPFTREGGEIRVQLDGRPGLVTVLEEYFPGWQVLTGGGWKEVRPTRNGLLRTRVTAGQTEARFRFRRWTRPRTAGWLLTGLTALVLLVPCAWRPRRREAPPPGRG